LISFFVPFVGSPTRKFIRVHPGTSGYKKNEKTPQWHRRTRLPVAAPSRCVSLLAPLSAPRAPLLSNYIALYQTIEILNAAPKGKIGRLPRTFPEQVNRRLENGEKGQPDFARWSFGKSAAASGAGYDWGHPFRWRHCVCHRLISGVPPGRARFGLCGAGQLLGCGA